jgi:hypothetical protein
MFHLLTMFAINAAEQEKYYITNVLKKPQRINVRQFVWHVEQLNAYIAQMPCFYYSPHANASTKPENIPFMEAELGAHVLRMCPLMWQDQYNLNKKSMMPMDMRLLLTSLEAVECVCTYKKGKSDNLRNPTSLPTKARKGRNALVPILWAGFPSKSALKSLRSIANYARSMGAHIPCTTQVIVVGTRRTEHKNLVSALLRKAERKTIP